MKLTNRELALVSDYSAARRRWKLYAWVGLVIVIAIWIATFYIDRLNSISNVLALFLGLLVAEMASLYSSIRPEDKIFDLLQRYINQDAEALKQFSSRRSSDGIAA